MTESESDATVVHPSRAAPRPDDVRRALVEQFLRNGDAGDDAANSDLVAAVCAGIRRAQDAARAGVALPAPPHPGSADRRAAHLGVAAPGIS